MWTPTWTEAAEHLWGPSSAWMTVHLPKYRWLTGDPNNLADSVVLTKHYWLQKEHGHLVHEKASAVRDPSPGELTATLESRFSASCTHFSNPLQPSHPKC